jgi:hypothetical protein
MRLRRDMRTDAGCIMAAPLAIAAPETGGWRDRVVVRAPDRIVAGRRRDLPRRMTPAEEDSCP